MKTIKIDFTIDEVTQVLRLSLQSLIVLGAIASPAMASGLKPLGTYSTGIYDDAAANIPAYDPATQNLFLNKKTGILIFLSFNYLN